MTAIKPLRLLCVLALSLSAFAMGCSDSDDAADPNIVELAVADGRFTTLVDLLGATGLDATLEGPGPFTVFAPTDDAFAAFEAANPGVLAGLSTQEATNVLLYHVLNGAVPSTTVTGGLVFADTVEGSPVLFDTSSGVAINDANIVITDLEAANGVIHVIDAVLLPPSQDIVGIATSGGFDTLATLVTNAGLVPSLQADGPLTVFAPTDAAFAAFETANPGLLAALSDDQVFDILTYHVVASRVFAGQILDGMAQDSLMPGQPLVFDRTAGVDVANGTVTSADILATNGVVHVVDEVLLPADIAGTAVAAGSFTTLVQLLTDSNLVGAVSFDGMDPDAQLTVFAPSDAAFEAFEAANPGVLASLTPAQVSNILQYHVVQGRVLAADLSNGTVPALNGDDIAVDVSGSAPTVAGVSVVSADIRTLNGIIHVIDNVMLPPSL